MITERFHMLRTKHAAYVRELRTAAAENRMVDAQCLNAEVDAVRQSIMLEALRMVGVPDEEISGMAERALIGHHRRGRSRIASVGEDEDWRLSKARLGLGLPPEAGVTP